MSSTATSGRLAHLLRWIGLTLVALTGLQVAALLAAWNWSLEPFRQLFVDRLVGETPMALVGLLLMLIASRFEAPAGRTALRWVVGLIGIVLAITMVVAVPISIEAETALAQQMQQSEATIAQQTSQLEMQKKQLQDPGFVDKLIAEAEKEGRIPAGASAEMKKQKAQEFIDTQLKPQLEQAEQQLGQARLARDVALQQRRFSGTARAGVLAIGFALVALAALV
ncbi:MULTISPECIES: HpsJ family protein [Aphanothece]|uniref:HpsJ family protein n=1 Tax=Aphanothece TaxID=1121 RepID=UPI003984AC96